MKSRLLFGCGVLAVVVGMTAATGFADSTLGNVKPHRHYIKLPNATTAEVGPRLCDHFDFANNVATNPGVQRAFNQFHNNVHFASDPNAQNEAAPGLHNHAGGEISSGKCF